LLSTSFLAALAMRRFRIARGDSREALLRALPRGAVCAEIGVLEGDFSERILAVTRPRRLHLIDPWKFEPADTYERAVYGRSHVPDQARMDAMYEQVRHRFASELRTGSVIINRTRSTEAAGQFENLYFDWVYIDGNHLYEFVRRDLESYYPKVKAGGLLAGDDYGVNGWWRDGVTRAVNEFASGTGLKLRTRGTQFILRKPLR
jgi:hypothetical protein